MSTSFSTTETSSYNDLSVAQLLHATERQLQHMALGERIATTICRSEVDTLGRDAFEVLRFERSIKNSFAPINRVPPEIFSIISDYFCNGDMDRALIVLTHVCRCWRNTLTSCSSLWAQLDFMNVDKTRAYIQRSQSSPLKLRLELEDDDITNQAFPLVIPHLHRLKSLTINTRTLPSVLAHFRCHTPLLENLCIEISTNDNPILDSVLFNGDLSSLRDLHLSGAVTHLPWKSLANLRVFKLQSSCPRYTVTQLLDLFESAPLLHTVVLWNSIQDSDSSDTPPGRIVHLPHLKLFDICITSPPLSILHHLHIPAGASLISQQIYWGNKESPLLDHLPGRSPNLNNLSHIATVNISFGISEIFVRLSGSSGNLRIRTGVYSSSYIHDQILRSLCHPIFLTVQRLTVTWYVCPGPGDVEGCPVFRTLTWMNNLQTLVLIDCHPQFILALDPEQNSSGLVLCPNVEKLGLYVDPLSETPFDFEAIFRMVKNRASRGVKLSSIRFGVAMDEDEHLVEKNVLGLREHVTHVEYEVASHRPLWDYVPGGGDHVCDCGCDGDGEIER